jgi:hypothetical protein
MNLNPDPIPEYDPGDVIGGVDPDDVKHAELWEGDECQRCSATVPLANEHTCPFAVEIHDDDTLCNCCDDCAGNCRMEI